MRKKVAIEYRTNRLTFAPLLPTGSLIYSALVLMHRFGGYSTRSRTRMEFCQSHSKASLSKFGAGTINFSQKFFGNTLLPEQILRRYTLYGFYSLGLSNSAASEWATHLAVGSAARHGHFVSLTRYRGADRGLRWCQECVAADQRDFGFSTWRVVHQLPFIQWCHAHNLPLRMNCKICKRPLDDGTMYRLPGENCSQCGSSRSENIPGVLSDGHRMVNSVSERIFGKQSDEFRPENWTKRVARFLASHRSRQAAEKLLVEKICTKWGIRTLDQISGRPTDFLDENLVTKLFDGEKKMLSLVGRIVVSDALSDA